MVCTGVFAGAWKAKELTDELTDVDGCVHPVAIEVFVLAEGWKQLLMDDNDCPQ